MMKMGRRSLGMVTAADLTTSPFLESLPVGGPAERVAGHERALARCPASVHLGARLANGAVGRRRLGRQLDEGSGQAQGGGGGNLEPALCQASGAACEGGQLRGEFGLWRRLQVGGAAVPPSAVEAPNAALDEFGVVVDGLEVGAVQEVGRSSHAVQDVVEAGSRVHELDR